MPHHLCLRADLTGRNIEVAKGHLHELNKLIEKSYALAEEIPRGICIPISEIAFTSFRDNIGYTKLKCSPYTYHGEISNVPFSLFFATKDFDSPGNDSTHGEILYFLSGAICRAVVHCWRKGALYTYNIRHKDDELYIHDIKSTIRLDESGNPQAIYEDDSIIQARAFRKKEHEIYDWIQSNLADVCPKSYSAYRRMKNQNTKNYRKIVEAARAMGYEIT